jgi:hypothetical protein
VWRDNGDTIGIQLGYNGIYQIRIWEHIFIGKSAQFSKRSKLPAAQRPEKGRSWRLTKIEVLWIATGVNKSIYDLKCFWSRNNQWFGCIMTGDNEKLFTVFCTKLWALTATENM